MAEFLEIKSFTEKNKKIVLVKEKDMYDLERTFFEYKGLLTLITQFTSDTLYKPNEERYNKILEEYLRSYAEFNVEFNLLINKYFTKEEILNNTIQANFEICAFEIIGD